jgi:hypothetical protein
MSAEKLFNPREESDLSKQTWKLPPSGRCDIYSNLYHLHWTLVDVRIRFGVILPNQEMSPEQATPFIQEVGAVTMSWAQAKALRDSISEAVKRYEEKNGEIGVLQLP